MSHTSHTYRTIVPDMSKLKAGDSFCLGDRRIKIASTIPLDIHLEGLDYPTRQDLIKRFVQWRVEIERPIEPPKGYKIVVGRAGTWLPEGSYYWHYDRHEWVLQVETGYVTLDNKLYAAPRNVGPFKRRTKSEGHGTYIDVDGILEAGVLVEVRVVDESET